MRKKITRNTVESKADVNRWKINLDVDGGIVDSAGVLATNNETRRHDENDDTGDDRSRSND